MGCEMVSRHNLHEIGHWHTAQKLAAGTPRLSADNVNSSIDLYSLNSLFKRTRMRFPDLGRTLDDIVQKRASTEVLEPPPREPPKLQPHDSNEDSRTTNHNNTLQSYTLRAGTPQKHVIEPITDEDGTPLGQLINQDSEIARAIAFDLCVRPDPSDSHYGLVFWTDASYEFITTSEDVPYDEVRQWRSMKTYPQAYRAGVAIAWGMFEIIDTRSPCSRDQLLSTTRAGAWRTRFSNPKYKPRPSRWHATHEVAYQVTGLQHFNQAELLAITLALRRACAIFYYRRPPNVNTMTICTDSKPAMWDLISDNWHTKSARTGSEYWEVREGNTKGIVDEAREYFRVLKMLDVEVKVMWVPGHKGVPGNEWVDQLSRFARFVKLPEEGGGKGVPVVWNRVERRVVVDSESEGYCLGSGRGGVETCMFGASEGA